MSDILDDFQKKARDHARVPMQVNDLSLTFDCSWIHCFFSVGCNSKCWVHNWRSLDARERRLSNLERRSTNLRRQKCTLILEKGTHHPKAIRRLGKNPFSLKKKCQ